MLQIAPSFVPRRQFNPSTTGTKKKLAMNFACSTTMACTSASFCDANQKGISPRTTIEIRLIQISRRWDALRIDEALVEVVRERAAGDEENRVHRRHDRGHHRHQEQRAEQRRHHRRRHDAGRLVGRRQERKEPAHADAEDHHARADQRLRRPARCRSRSAPSSRRASSSNASSRTARRQSTGRTRPERDQLAPGEPPAGDARFDRSDVLAQRRQAADVRQHDRHGEEQRQHHDQRLHELDVRAGANAAERRCRSRCSPAARPWPTIGAIPKMADAISPMAWNWAVRKIV